MKSVIIGWYKTNPTLIVKIVVALILALVISVTCWRESSNDTSVAKYEATVSLLRDSLKLQEERNDSLRKNRNAALVRGEETKKRGRRAIAGVATGVTAIENGEFIIADSLGEEMVVVPRDSVEVLMNATEALIVEYNALVEAYDLSVIESDALIKGLERENSVLRQIVTTREAQVSSMKKSKRWGTVKNIAIAGVTGFAIASTLNK